MALGATGLAIVAYETDLLRSLELSTVNTRFSIRGRRRPPANVVLVEIDATTFDELGLQWPFPRRVHARVIENIAREHPRVIAYDVQFTEASACPSPPTGSQPPPGPVPAGAQRRDRAARQRSNNAEGRTVMATTETDAHGNTRFLGSGEGNDAAGRSGVAARQRAAAHRSGRRPATGRAISVGGLKTLAVASAEVAEGHRDRPRAVRRTAPPGSTTTGRRERSQAMSFSNVYLGQPAARLLPRQDRRRRSLGAVAAGPPPDVHRRRNAGRRSPGQRDRDGAAGPAAALGRRLAGPRADRAAGLRHAAGQPAVRPDRHDRAGRRARGGVHGRRADRVRRRERRVVRVPARRADPQRRRRAVGAAGHGRLRARAGARPVLALRARERRRRGPGQRRRGAAPGRRAARGQP